MTKRRDKAEQRAKATLRVALRFKEPDCEHKFVAIETFVVWAKWRCIRCSREVMSTVS